MNKKDQGNTDWKPNSSGGSGEERLASSKTRTGGRMTGRSGKRRRALTVAVIVVVVLAVALYVLSYFGVFQQNLTLMQVGDQKISVAAFNYWYGNILMEYNLQPDSDALKEPAATSTSGEAEESVRDVLIRTAANQLQQIYIEAGLARDEGLELGEYEVSVQQRIDDILEQTGGSPGQANIVLKRNYGAGCTLNVVRGLYENMYLAAKFADVKKDETDVSPDALAAYYDENADTIDKVDYRAFTFSFYLAGEATDAERDEAKKQAEEKATTFFDAVDTEQDFIDQALEATEEAQREEFEENDGSLIAGKTSDQLTEAMKEWAFDSDRSEGDMEIVEGDSSYTVAYFLERYRPETPLAAVRHILLTVEEDATDEEREAVRTQAEELAGQATDEESFIELVRLHSDDANSLPDGGLYTGISEDSAYVEPFLEWSVDEDRAEGDTGVVETDYGYHVMYFSGREPEWMETVRTRLRDEAYEQYILDMTEEDRFAYSLDPFALRFVN